MPDKIMLQERGHVDFITAHARARGVVFLLPTKYSTKHVAEPANDRPAVVAFASHCHLHVLLDVLMHSVCTSVLIH